MSKLFTILCNFTKEIIVGEVPKGNKKQEKSFATLFIKNMFSLLSFS